MNADWIPAVPTDLAPRLMSPTPQRAFAWGRERWRLLDPFDGVADLLDRLPEEVDRESTRHVVLDEFEAGRIVPAFVAAMVWGYGTTGYGPRRTTWVLAGTKVRGASLNPHVPEHLADGAKIARMAGAEAGYRYLNNEGYSKYLRAAFFTKWLYFTTAVQGLDDTAAAPILDMQVRNWIATHADVRLELGSTAEYGRYLALLDAWGHPDDAWSLSRCPVEREIFGLATGR